MSLVNRWAQAGRLVMGPDGKIDPAASDKALAETIDRTRGGVGGGGVVTRTVRDEATKSQHEPEPTSNRMTDAKIRAAEYDAKLKQLEYEREVGKVVLAERAVAATVDVYAVLSRSVRQIADRTSAVLAAEMDPRKVHATLTAEFDTVLNRAADAIEALPEQLARSAQ